MLPITVGRINLKPLLPSAASLKLVDPNVILRKLQKDVLKRLKANIMLQSTFSQAAKRALSSHVKVEVGASSITVKANHPAFRPLVEGQRKQQMTWLLKARRPIPIVTETGELIFRSATPRSMRNGKWVHPGRAPTTILEKARAEARDHIKKAIRKDLAKQVKEAFHRSMKGAR